jgi:hypothetical protein
MDDVVNETEQERLQRILETRIKRHGVVDSYKRGCRCNRCKRALATKNKNQYAKKKEAINLTASNRSKYSIACRNWLEEYFPEVAQSLKESVENNGLQ